MGRDAASKGFNAHGIPALYFLEYVDGAGYFA